MGEKFDCTKCGLCCVSLFDEEVFCDVQEKDLDKFDKKFIEKYVIFPNIFDLAYSAIMRSGAGKNQGALKTKFKKISEGPLRGYEACCCVMLQGNPGKKVSCKIYKKRPEVCRRSVKPGDSVCKTIRRAFEKLLRGRTKQCQ